MKLFFTPPRIQSMMTGVSYVIFDRHNGNTATAVYVDGTQEISEINPAIVQHVRNYADYQEGNGKALEVDPDFFEIVSEIQSKRQPITP